MHQLSRIGYLVLFLLKVKLISTTESISAGSSRLTKMIYQSVGMSFGPRPAARGAKIVCVNAGIGVPRKQIPQTPFSLIAIFVFVRNTKSTTDSLVPLPRWRKVKMLSRKNASDLHEYGTFVRSREALADSETKNKA